jgi:hypothetical protein
MWLVILPPGVPGTVRIIGKHYDVRQDLSAVPGKCQQRAFSVLMAAE